MLPYPTCCLLWIWLSPFTSCFCICLSLFGLTRLGCCVTCGLCFAFVVWFVGSGKLPDLKLLQVECRTRRSLGRERIGRSQWCEDNHCECGMDTATTLDTYFSFENREKEIERLQSDTHRLFQWWQDPSLRKNPKKEGHRFLVVAGASGTGKSTFIRKAFVKMQDTPLGGSGSEFDSLVGDCVKSGNLFQISLDRLNTQEPLAFHLLTQALKYTSAYSTATKVKQAIEQSGGDWRQLTLELVFGFLFGELGKKTYGEPGKKTNMVVLQLDEINFVKDM